MQISLELSPDYVEAIAEAYAEFRLQDDLKDTPKDVAREAIANAVESDRQWAWFDKLSLPDKLLVLVAVW